MNTFILTLLECTLSQTHDRINIRTPIFVPLCPVAYQRCLEQGVFAPVGGARESKWPSPACPDR